MHLAEKHTAECRPLLGALLLSLSISPQAEFLGALSAGPDAHLGLGRHDGDAPPAPARPSPRRPRNIYRAVYFGVEIMKQRNSLQALWLFISTSNKQKTHYIAISLGCLLAPVWAARRGAAPDAEARGDGN